MHVAALYRFPVKGFPGQRLATAEVRAGSGIIGDRAVALSSGATPAEPGRWARPRTFTVLKNDTSLQAWAIDAETLGSADTAPEAAGTSVPEAVGSSVPEAVGASVPEAVLRVRMRAPDGASVEFSTDDAAARSAAADFLAARLQAHGPHPRQLISADQGMFDSQPSGLSLINPATVEALARLACRPIDPLRFRGNILLSGLPAFAEFGLIGTELAIGEVRAVVRSSIERCPATEVDPRTAAVDLPVPRLLAAGCGHLHCGIYAVVTAGGRIRPGDPIEVGARTRAHRTPAPTPRFATVEAVTCAEGAAELTLRDELGMFADLYSPGMHMRVHLPGAPAPDPAGGPPAAGVHAPTWRSYTVTSANGQSFTLCAATRQGVSAVLAALEPGDRLLVSGPFGRVVPENLSDAVVLLTAGIGITPALGLLPGLQGREVTVVHSERSTSPGRLFTELSTRAAALRPAAQVHRHCTRTGRLEAAELAAVLRTAAGSAAELSVVACGPPGFLESVRAAAGLAGLAPAAVHAEIFTSPAALQAPDLSAFSAATVRTTSGAELCWQPARGMLLDALEQEGIPADSQCRGGACGTCAVGIRTGQVAYPIEPTAPRGADEVLLCQAVPVGDIVLDL